MILCDLLNKFILQSKTNDLKYSDYPKEWSSFKMKVSFGQGAAARVPWIAFTAPDITVSNGYYPVYLLYKELGVLILAYGISETNEFKDTWPDEVTSNQETIRSFLGSDVPRYGDSFVFKAYRLGGDNNNSLVDYETGQSTNNEELESDLDAILSKYQKATLFEAINPSSTVSQGVFYLEKQLEDFIIQNWANTSLGKEYDLIFEDGELKSQQYRTSIGPIDILAKDKKTGCHVVIELKKNQTSDDTIGQIARYMGWIQSELHDDSVRGIIIAQAYDKKLEYALKRVNGVEVYVYEINFRLTEFKSASGL